MKNKLAIILSSALIVVCTLCITLSSFAGAGGKRGDVNLDGKVSLLDAKYVLQYIADMRTLSQKAMANADADGDGDIDLTDAKYILEAVAGIRKLSDIDIGTSEFDSSGYIDLDDSTNPSTTRKQSITIEYNDNTKDATIDWRN